MSTLFERNKELDEDEKAFIRDIGPVAMLATAMHLIRQAEGLEPHEIMAAAVMAYTEYFGEEGGVIQVSEEEFHQMIGEGEVKH